MPTPNKNQHPSIRVLVVDDHAIVRDGLARLLVEAGIGCLKAGSAQEACQILAGNAGLDVVLLDLNLPDRSGLEVLPEIRTLRPGIAVLVVSMHDETQYGARAIALGAMGYLTKNATTEEIVLAVRAVAGGQRHVSPKLATQIQNGAEGNSALERLTDREFQVMHLIGAGKSLAEIAQTLGISSKTVSTYRERILAKTGLTGSLDIMRQVLREGMLGPL